MSRNNLDAMAPEQARLHPSSPSAQSINSRQQRHHYSVKARRLEKRLLRTKWVASAVGVLFVLTIILAKFEIEALERKNKGLDIKAQKQEIELSQTKEQLEELKNDLKVLATGRIPRLKSLEFDRPISVNEKYVRNIIFTITGLGQNVKYEYRIVLHNNSLNIINPMVNIVLFDELGIQVGTTSIAPGDATTRTRFIDLKPGETRSYSAQIPLDRNAKPNYFLLTIG